MRREREKRTAGRKRGKRRIRTVKHISKRLREQVTKRKRKCWLKIERENVRGNERRGGGGEIGLSSQIMV